MISRRVAQNLRPKPLSPVWRVFAATSLALAILVASPPAFSADETDDLKAFHRYWGAFVAGEGSDKRCFAATQPQETTTSQPVRSRGKPFLLVSTFPSDGTVNEVSAVLGFKADNNAGLTLKIDGQEFAMFGDGEQAWLASDTNDKVLEAMRKGVSATVVATSATRGTRITDAYSLLGLSKALESVAEECK